MKRRGRKVTGEIWTIDFTPTKNGKSLSYREVSQIGDMIFGNIKGFDKDWMLQSVYSVFSLHRKAEKIKRPSNILPIPSLQYIEENWNIHISLWHVHTVLYYDGSEDEIINGIINYLEKSWKNICNSKGIDVSIKYRVCDNPGKVIYSLWQNCHSTFYSNRKQRFKDMVSKFNGIFGGKKVPRSTWEVWEDNLEEGLLQLGGIRVLFGFDFGNVKDEKTKKHLEKLRLSVYELWDDISDARENGEYWRIYKNLKEALERKDIRPFLEGYYKASNRRALMADLEEQSNRRFLNNIKKELWSSTEVK